MSSRVWSFTSLDYVRPSSVVLHSISKHAPLRSLTVVSPHEAAPAARRTPPHPVRQQPVVRTSEHQQQQQQERRQQQQQQEWQEQQRQEQQQQQEQWHQQQQEEQQQPAQLEPGDACDPASTVHSAQHQVLFAAAADAAAPGGTHGSSSSSSRSRSTGSGPGASRRQQQPPALSRLLAAAQSQQTISPAELSLLLDELLPLLQQLSAKHLAQAAWAASVLAQQQSWRHQQLLSPDWQQSLLDAASSHFSSSSSSGAGGSDGLSAATAATLLQALVRLQLHPGEAWLDRCCSSMAVGQWSDPRALSSVAACLARLGHVPGAPWRDAFFAATTSHLPAFPAISLARMLHAAAAWQFQQHQQQPLVPGRLLLPEAWLLGVLRSLGALSSQLKPSELAMLLQSMQRLQQCQPVLPAAGASPSTSLQQAAAQLQRALIAGVAQHAARSSGRDLTVTLQAVAAMQQQQQLELQAAADGDLVSWPWLQQVLTAAQAMLPRLDPRGMASCISAAAILLKPHLQRQQPPRTASAAAAAHQPMQQQQAAAPERQRRLRAVPGQAGLARPLQRWLLLQQGEAQQPQQGEASQQQQPQQQQPQPAAAATATSASSSGGVDAAGLWLAWLDAFYISSLPALEAFSCEDLVQSLSALATLGTVPPLPWYEGLLAALQHQAARALQPAPPSSGRLLTHRQAAGAAWALGRLALLPSQHDAGVSLVPSPAWLQRLYAAATAAAVGSYLGDQPPGSAGGSSSSSRESGVGDASEVVRLMWAAAVCDFDPGDDWWAAAERQLLWAGGSQAAGVAVSPATADQQEPPTPPPRQLPARLLGAAVQAYAASRRPIPQPVLQQLVATAAVVRQLQQQPLQNTLRLLRGLKRAGCRSPQQWLLQLAAAFQGRLAGLAPHELPQLLCCLADSGLKLPHPAAQQQQQQQDQQQQDGVSAAAQQQAALAAGVAGSGFSESCLAAASQLLPRMSSTDISLLLWACAKLQLKPPTAWLEAALQRMQASFLAAKPGALALCIDGLSRLAYRPSADWMAGLMMATHRRFGAAAAAGPGSRGRLRLVQHVLQTLGAFARLGASPSPRWLKDQLLLVHGQLPLLRPRHVAALLLSLARLGCRPPARFLQNLVDTLGDCSACSALDLVHVIYAAAVLRWQPARPWVVCFLAASLARMPQMSPQGLALLHWGLAVLRVVPPEPWRRAAAAAVCARLPEFGGRALGMVVWSWGRHKMALGQLGGSANPAVAGPAAGAGGEDQPELSLEQTLQQALQQMQQQEQGGSRAGEPPVGAAAGPGVLVPQGRSSLWSPSQRQQVAVVTLAAAWQLRGSYSAASLVHLLAGVAKMRLQPGQPWLRDMVQHGSQERLSVLTAYELQQLVWALAQLRFRAAPSWLKGVELLLEVRWMQMQKQDGTRHGAAWALEQLRQLALPQPQPAAGEASGE